MEVDDFLSIMDAINSKCTHNAEIGGSVDSPKSLKWMLSQSQVTNDVTSRVDDDEINWINMETKQLKKLLSGAKPDVLFSSIVRDSVVQRQFGIKDWPLREFVLQSQDRRVFIGGQAFVMFVRRHQHSSSLAMRVALHRRNGERIERFVRQAKLQFQAAEASQFVNRLLACYVTDSLFLSVSYKASFASLKVLKSRVGVLPHENVRYYSACVLDAVTKLHEMNIAHRDIKADNVLITSQGIPQLCDFGLATNGPIRHEEYHKNPKIPTMKYYPPEYGNVGRLINVYKTDSWLFGFFLAELSIADAIHMWQKFENLEQANWKFSICSSCRLEGNEDLVTLLHSLLRADPIERALLHTRSSYYHGIRWHALKHPIEGAQHPNSLLKSAHSTDVQLTS